MGEISKKKVLVTGGVSGIGSSIVLRFLEGGYHVVINYFGDEEKARAVTHDLERKGYAPGNDFVLFDADISNEEVFVNKANELRVDSLELLINNAGILKRGDFSSLSQKDWLDVFNVNVFGIVNTSKWFMKNCPQANCIINMGSVRGLPHVSRTENIIYSVSKSTVPTLTAVLAKALGPKIRVNAIIPGTIDTPQRQGITKQEAALYGEENAIIKRLGAPKEVADLCFFLASKEAGYITGSNFTIDGGYSINYIR